MESSGVAEISRATLHKSNSESLGLGQFSEQIRIEAGVCGHEW